VNKIELENMLERLFKMCPWEEPVEVNIGKMLLFWSDDVD
jgi:hypothetical protein